MFAAHLHIKKYDWDVTMFFDVTPDEAPDVLRMLRNIDCPRGIMRDSEQLMRGGSYDEGFTYSNFALKSTIIAMNRASSLGEMLNTFSHERGHLMSHIARRYGISMHSEEAAYMKGDIDEMLYHGFVDLVQHLYKRISNFVIS